MGSQAGLANGAFRGYSYPQTNRELIGRHGMQHHPEGGFYAVTHSAPDRVPSPFAENQELRPLASCIYYLLCSPSRSIPLPPSDGQDAKSFEGWKSDIDVFHLNKSATMHLHHAGRTEYTHISAKAPLGQGLQDEHGLPLTKVITMGDDLEKGEVRQLLVEGGWWKVSQIPHEDRQSASQGLVDPDRVGALISEVVFPGFDWKDHTYLNLERLRDLFAGDGQEEFVAKYRQHVKEH